MKILYFLVLISLVRLPLFAQPTNRIEPVLNTQFGTITEFIAPKDNKIETVYLLDNWQSGTAYLKNNSTIKAYKVNYDIELDMVEFKTAAGIKVLPGQYINKLTLWVPGQDSIVYVNCNSLNNLQNCFGLYEVVQGGIKIQMLKKIKTEILKANYDAITHSGDKNDRVVKKEKYFIATESAIIPLNNPDYSIFASRENEVKEYAKANKLNMKRTKDIPKLVAYYNSFFQ